MKNCNYLLSPKKAQEVEYYMPTEKKLRSLAEFFYLFSDTTRLKIISALSISEMCVTDISTLLHINQTTISHQLKTLKTLGVVTYRRSGKVIYYSLVDSSVNDCMMTAVNYLDI